MISTLRGQITQLHENYLVIELGGIGYQVFMSPLQLSKLKKGSEVELSIYDHVREIAHDLYGFLELGERLLFEQLISVSGVGPKMALNVMSSATADNIRDGIASGQSDVLQTVSGVGKKTAERIVVELKNKVIGDGSTLSGVSSQDVAVAALQQLGYTNRQAKEAVSKVPADIDSEEERIKFALRQISSK